MVTLRFDLNDIVHEPSDEELASLMEAVAEEGGGAISSCRNK